MITGDEVDRAQIIQRSLEWLEKYYQKFEETSDMSGLMEEYNQMLVNRGSEVCVLDPCGEYRGKALGINGCRGTAGGKRRWNDRKCLCRRSIRTRRVWIRVNYFAAGNLLVSTVRIDRRHPEHRMKQKEERNNVMKKDKRDSRSVRSECLRRKILSESAVLQTAGAHPSGTADHVCTVYTESRRNPDAGIYAGRSSGV